MRIITEGHEYELMSGDTLSFLQKAGGELVQDGTTSEEVLEVLIDRLHFLDGVLPCVENAIAMRHLWAALSQMRLRTLRRVKKGVEGSDNNHEPIAIEPRDDDEIDVSAEDRPTVTVGGLDIYDMDDDDL